MCGILGLATVYSGVRPNPELLIKQRDALTHRGPDDAGAWWSDDGRVGLAHRRLAILDLSPTGHQPMQDESGRLHIIFNGEIYNHQDLRRELGTRGHRFRSTSDTEVILVAYREWGAECLQHLNGQFAFGLYDDERHKLFIARDRVGEKPVFYRLSNARLSFASELKALFADPAFPRQVDAEALDCYLAFGYVPGDRSILQGVNKLPPAHAMSFDLTSGALEVWRYWQLPAPPKTSAVLWPGGEVELLDELEHLLEGSVRRQLVADVPVGVLLSGGVDSSLATAMAARCGSRIKTFTIRFPGYGGYDETEHARLIARHFSTEHVELEAEPSTVDLLPELARQFDEPIVDSSMIPTYLLSKLVRRHCKVALGGDGGDELFGGYIHYGRLLWLQQRLGFVPLRLRGCVARLAEKFLPVGLKGRNWLQAWGADLKSELPLIATYFSERERKDLLIAARYEVGQIRQSAEAIRRRSIPAHADLLQRATRADFENYLPEDILVKVDRASMFASLEVRAPWLDYRLVEFAFGKVPSRLKATSVDLKILPKKLAQRLLPPEFNSRRKQGFSIPLASWLRGKEWRGFFRSVLLEAEGSFFNRDTVLTLLKGQEQGRSNSERLFALVLFELWRREYNIRT